MSDKCWLSGLPADCDVIAERDALRVALEKLLHRYVMLIESGDCGFWNPEEEDVVIQARNALKEK